MEEEKNVFISYLDDDGSKKDIWVASVEEQTNRISFIYNGQKILVPWHRVLKIKEQGEKNE
jgi:uncharacterized protein (UPF0248 family)